MSVSVRIVTPLMPIEKLHLYRRDPPHTFWLRFSDEVYLFYPRHPLIYLSLLSFSGGGEEVYGRWVSVLSFFCKCTSRLAFSTPVSDCQNVRYCTKAFYPIYIL